MRFPFKSRLNVIRKIGNNIKIRKKVELTSKKLLSLFNICQKFIRTVMALQLVAGIYLSLLKVKLITFLVPIIGTLSVCRKERTQCFLLFSIK